MCILEMEQLRALSHDEKIRDTFVGFQQYLY
jgi:hypothetical protein